MRRLVSGPFGFLTGVAMFAALVVGLFSVAGVAAQTPAVSVGALTTSVGLEGTVALEAHDIGPPGLGAWTIDITYDSAVASAAGCAAEHGGICNLGFGANTIRVTGISAFGLEGDSLLATITFACVSVGVSELSLSLDVLADATPGAPTTIDAATNHGSVTCAEEGTALPPTPTPSPAELPGDANCDGAVNAIDAALILQATAQLIDAVSCSENADVNGDGVIDVLDAALILQMDAGLL